MDGRGNISQGPYLDVCPGAQFRFINIGFVVILMGGEVSGAYVCDASVFVCTTGSTPRNVYENGTVPLGRNRPQPNEFRGLRRKGKRAA